MIHLGTKDDAGKLIDGGKLIDAGKLLFFTSHCSVWPSQSIASAELKIQIGERRHEPLPLSNQQLGIDHQVSRFFDVQSSQVSRLLLTFKVPRCR